MASFTYNGARKEILDGTIDLLTDTMKVMLVTSSYVADKDHNFVDEAGADDPIDHELSGTGYVAGFGGSGRKTLAGKAVVQDDANDRAEFDFTDPTWTGINAGTAAAHILFIPGTADDTDARLIAYIDSGGWPVVTNGGNLTIQNSTEGAMHLNG